MATLGVDELDSDAHPVMFAAVEPVEHFHQRRDRPDVALGDELASSALNLAKANPRLRPLHLVVRETEFCGLRLAGYFRRRMRENSRNSVRRPRCASLTRRNYGGFCLPGNRPGLSGLHGGGCRDRTDGHRSLASLQNEAARRGFSARNDLSQRMSKSLAGKPKAPTMNRYWPVLPVSTSVCSATISKPSASAKRETAARWASMPSPERPCSRVLTR